MGRITIFVTDGNAACTRTLAAFREWKVPVTIINLTRYPNKRTDMVALCMSQSTPQVYFNTRYVGGADETIELLRDWAKKCEIVDNSCNASITSKSSSGSGQQNKTGRRSSAGSKLSTSKHSHSKHSHSNHTSNTYSSIYERYVAEIGNFHDPNDKRLSIPDTEPILDEPTLPRDSKAKYCVTIPDDTSTVLEMTEMLLDLLKHEDHTIGPTTYKKSFFGSNVIKIIRGAFEVSEKEAIKIAAHFLSLGIYHSIDGPSGISFDGESLYRLQCYQTPNILNSFRIWTEQVDSDALRLINHLIMKFNTVEIAATDKYGILHPRTANKMPEYNEFEEAICELQGVNLSRMNDRTKIVSFLLVRNSMILLGIKHSSKLTY
jgi:glutaredoxin